MNVGDKLRQARHEKELSLRALGELTGFSASFLSQVELGQSSPSLGSLQRIAEALGIDLATLVSTRDAPSAVLRRARREAFKSEWSRATAESLVPPGTDERLHAMLLRIDPGGRTGRLEHAVGRTMFAYVVTGSVRLVIDGEERPTDLEEGDSIVLVGPRRVGWENKTRKPAEVVTTVVRLGAPLG
jgi:transcriptional regulator with XRE-family HTH domain